MNRIEWNELSADERRAYADPTRRCIERGCTEPAGTPWGKYWCSSHEEQRLERITRQFKALLLPEDPTP